MLTLINAQQKSWLHVNDYTLIMMIYITVFCILVVSFIAVKCVSMYSVFRTMNKFYGMFIPEIEYFPTDDVQWCKILRDNWQIVRDEYINYVQTYGKFKRLKELDINQSELDSTSIPWEVLFLRCYNADTNKVQYFPRTVELCKSVPGCSLAMFSILKPGQYLPRHLGPYKGVLRYQLSLIIPKDHENCCLEVNEKKHCWKEGGDVMFDDTLIHSVHNNTDESRVILFLDVKRQFQNVFLDTLNNVILFLLQFNYVIDNIVDNTNDI